MRRSLTAGVFVIAAMAGAAKADILWNQLPDYDNANAAAHADLMSTQFGQPYAYYGVSDVTVPAGGWTIQSVSTYFSNINFGPTTTSAVLNIFPKTGALPTAANDPRATPTGQGTALVPVDVRGIGGATQQPVMTITANNLNIVLAPGDYWIGLTPALPSSFFGAENHWPAATMIGSPSATRYFDNTTNGAWTAVGPDQGVAAYDLAITVTGVPAPSGLALLGLAGAVAGRRRR